MNQIFDIFIRHILRHVVSKGVSAGIEKAADLSGATGSSNLQQSPDDERRRARQMRYLERFIRRLMRF